MELKLSVKETLDNLSSSSNRTFMELKYEAYAEGTSVLNEVLIVPLWN